MSYPWEDWGYITKVDPDKDLTDGETFGDVCKTNTDTLEIGDTPDTTEEKMERVIEVTLKYDVPIHQESSNPGVVIDDDALDGHLTPAVFNASGLFWIIGAYKEWVRIGDDLDWDHTHTKTCTVLNPKSSVAEYTDTDTDQSAEDVASFARVAEKMSDRKVIYVEYSGIYGDLEKVGTAYDAFDDTTSFYGGGICDYESVYEMGQHTDTVVVGNLLHDKSIDAVRETVEGAEDATAELIAE